MNKDRLIVLTGSGGRIGRSLIERILNQTSWRVLAFSSSLEETERWNGRVIVHRNEDISALLPLMQGIDTCVHMAFSRRFNTNKDIALSLDFSSLFFKSILASDCRVINLSSVGVYGLNSNFPDEKTPPSPDSLYSMAKYASEVLINSYFQGGERSFSNVRLSGVAQSQRVLPVFIDNAKNKGEIQITGGKQQFSWIDIMDAVDALIALIAYDGPWHSVYNVTLNKVRYQISELAEVVADVAELNGLDRTKITIIPNDDDPIRVGWNSELFMSETGWRPLVPIEETIRRMFCENTSY